MKVINKSIGLIVLAVVVLLAIPATRDEILWIWASLQNDTIIYQSYLKTIPRGRHATEARVRYDELGWADALAADTFEGFEKYVHLHGDSKHLAEALVKIEPAHWQRTLDANTIKAYQEYGATHPQGPHLREAQLKSEILRKDDAPYNAAIMAGTEISLKKFLEDYPGHQKENDAREAVRDIIEGRDIVDVLNEKKIEVQVSGSGIQSVAVRIRKLVPYPLAVRIPVGTFFVSANPHAQNMVTTAESTIKLESNEWEFISPEAACANRPRNVPRNRDFFTVQKSPHQTELARLVPVLDSTRVDTETRQAAVWIVTDDASYRDLGILVSSPFGFGGKRVIREQQTARAMQICDQAGIDITRKAIWKDRGTILSGLKNAALYAWLKQKR